VPENSFEKMKKKNTSLGRETQKSHFLQIRLHSLKRKKGEREKETARGTQRCRAATGLGL